MGLMRGRSGNAVIFSGHDKEKISYCQDSLKVKILSPLKHRIYLDEYGKIVILLQMLTSGSNAGHAVLW